MSRSLKILGIESSTVRCEVALALDEQVQISAQLPGTTRPTAALVPAIRELCRSVGWSSRELDLICVDLGPGSYTGLRVGVTCAKTLAFAAGAGLATAGSLAAAACNAGPDESLVEVALDAARGQVFAGRFRRQRAAGFQPASDDRGVGRLETCPTSAGEADAWIAERAVHVVNAADWASALDPSAVVLGPALVKYRELVPARCRVADEPLWWPRAATVVRLGLEQFRTGPLASYWTLEPLYLRPSAAEEKRTTAP